MNKPLNLLIAITGLAETGKSTAARILCQQLDLHGEAFAEPVTKACAGALGMIHNDFLRLKKNHYFTELSLTKRKFMQVMGKSLRASNPHLLIDSLERRLPSGDSYLFNGTLISDARMPKEIDWVRKQGGVVIHLHNNIAKPAPRDVTEQKQPVLIGDHIIENHGTLEELHSKLCALTNHLLAQAQKKAA